MLQRNDAFDGQDALVYRHDLVRGLEVSFVRKGHETAIRGGARKKLHALEMAFQFDQFVLRYDKFKQLIAGPFVAAIDQGM